MYALVVIIQSHDVIYKRKIEHAATYGWPRSGLDNFVSVDLPAPQDTHPKRAWAQSTPLQNSKSSEENFEECKS